MKDSDKPKIIIAAVVLLVAVVLIAYNLNLFGGGGGGGGGSAPNTPTLKEGAKGGPRAAPTPGGK